jgi:hypothetical protein
MLSSEIARGWEGHFTRIRTRRLRHCNDTQPGAYIPVACDMRASLLALHRVY